MRRCGVEGREAVNVRIASLSLSALLAVAGAAQAATFEFRFNNHAGEGFNDTTSFTPVGGNTATTLGAARRAVFVEAGRVWGLLLQSDVPVKVDATFTPLNCTATSATLGSAGPTTAFTLQSDPTIAY